MSIKDRIKYNQIMKEYMRKRRQTPKGKAEYKRADKARYKKFRDRLNEFKNKPCEMCGQKFPPHVMQFHHKNRDEKEFTISQSMRCTLEQLLAEIAKCELLCANCHAIKEYGFAR